MRAKSEPQLQERFREVYDETYADALRFATRRVRPEDAEDVVAEAFTVVWRRIDECPRATSDARAWIFGIVRHCLLNARRGGRRHEALGVRLAAVHPQTETPGVDVSARVDFARAWAHLPDQDQEVLALHVFEDLPPKDAAVVLGISAATYRVRLSRARARLRTHLDDAAPGRAMSTASTRPAASESRAATPTTLELAQEIR